MEVFEQFEGSSFPQATKEVVQFKVFDFLFLQSVIFVVRIVCLKLHGHHGFCEDCPDGPSFGKEAYLIGPFCICAELYLISSSTSELLRDTPEKVKV